MRKQLLVTIGNESDTSDSLRFVASFMGPQPDLLLTLFFATPHMTSETAAEIAMQDMTVARQRVEQTNGRRAQDMLNRSRDWLIAQGFSPAQVGTKIVTARDDVVREIIQEARKELYDAVVMGSRRASVWLEALIANSVSRRMLWQELDFPIWICRRPLADAGHHVLLCTDGSAESLRMADHVGFMLGESRDHWVTLLHVAAPGEDTAENTSFVLDKTMVQLLENGFPPDRIRTKTLSARRLSGAVVRELENGHYAVVAMGRRSGTPATLRKFFPASLSAVLLRNLDNFSLWVIK